MKLIIAGSRNINVSDVYLSCIITNFNLEPKEVISGTARGIDTCGEDYAEYEGLEIEYFPAFWDEYGKGAGHIRNKQMGEYGDVLLLIWDGKSRGSANMKKVMEKLKKPIYEVILKQHKKEVEL